MADKGKKEACNAFFSIRSLCSKAPSSSIGNFHVRPGPGLQRFVWERIVGCFGQKNIWENFGKRCLILTNLANSGGNFAKILTSQNMN
jgi:hypothetical protein